MLGLNKKEIKLFKRLDTPAKIQDFINALPPNFEKKGETCSSPRVTLERGTAHCLEGAYLAAAILWLHKKEPLLLDLKSSKKDFDHVVTLFKVGGKWGAISKTNHAVLRYREPVYESVRELAMSYFHEYFTNHDGKKTLESFSKPFNLKKFGASWIIEEDDLWDIGAELDDSPHIKIVTKKISKGFRKADPVEIEAGKLLEYKK
ncbi:MAG: hypothetical protein AAB477_00470 [Patescibacteria group bacterium]